MIAKTGKTHPSDAHPNSIKGRGTKEVRAQITNAERIDARYRRSMNLWASRGFMAPAFGSDDGWSR